jgi:hypothetical protein
MKTSYTKLAISFFRNNYPKTEDELFFDWTATVTHNAAVAAGSENMTETDKAEYLAALAAFAKEHPNA